MASGLSTKRGRSRELDQFQTGDLALELGNRQETAGTYNPENTASHLYGHVKPNRRIRVLARYAGTTYVVFDGYVDGFEQAYDELGKNATAQVTAGDAFKVLAQATLPEGSPFDLEVAKDRPLVWHKLGDFSEGGVMADSSGNGWSGQYLIGGTSTAGLVAETSDTAVDFDGTDDYAQLATHLDPGAVFLGSSIYPCVEFWIRTTQVPATQAIIISIHRSGDAPYALTLESDGHLEYQQAAADSVATVNDGAIHHVVLTPSGFYIDGALSGTTSIPIGIVRPGSGIYVADGPTPSSGLFDGTIDHIAFYDHELSATRILAHYNAGKAGATGAWGGDTTDEAVTRALDFMEYPTADRDISTGSSTIGSHSMPGGSVLSYLQQLADTEQSQFYCGIDGNMSSDHTFKVVWRARHAKYLATRSFTSQATFGPGGLKYADILVDYSEQGIYNDAEVTPSGGVPQRASNSNSQREQFKRTYTKSTLDETDNAAYDHAAYVVNTRADPEARIVGLVIAPQRDPANLWPQVLGREIGDRVTVNMPTIAGSVAQACVIEGVEHSMANGSWSTTWRLSQADVQTPWIWDDSVYSVWDSTTVWGF